MTAVIGARRSIAYRGGASLLRRAGHYSFVPALVVSVLLLVINVALQPNFGWTNQLATFAPLALAAMASTPPILAGRGGVDLSISPTMTLATGLLVVWLVPRGLGGPLAVPIVLAICAAVTTLNGLIVTVFRLPSIVVTLCAYFVLIGVDLKVVPQPQKIGSSWLSHLSGTVWGIPGGLFTIAVPLIIWGALWCVPYGRMLMAVGSNDATAFSAGVRVNLIRVSAYSLGGLFAGVAAFAVVSLTGTADASAASSYTILALVAVAVGGVSIDGGRGGLIGALLGAAAVYLMQDLLGQLKVSSAWLSVTYGTLLIAAVLFSKVFSERDLSPGGGA